MIKTADESGENLFSACGEYFTCDGEEVVDYVFDGDPCKLIFRKDSLTQLHAGSTHLRIIFAEGKTTGCDFAEGGLSGGYKIFTQKLDISKKAGSISARVLYHPEGDESLITRIKVCVIPQKF